MFKKRNKNEQKVLKLSDSENQKDKQGVDNLGQKPTKKVKIDAPKPQKNILSSSTATRKEQQQQDVHKNFTSLNYKASNSLQNGADKLEVVEEGIPFDQLQDKQIFIQNVQMTKLIKEGKLSKNIYRGQNNYANYSLTNKQLENAEQTYRQRKGPGPSRANNNVRNICRFDYDKALCKDWHDAGYCVFGNSCLYLHDRSNYKTGWELEKEYEQNQRQRWKRINDPDYQEKPAYVQEADKFKVDDICKHCSNIFKKPVAVDCGHIFCFKCANQLNVSPGLCCICKKKLSGIMNNAQKTIEKQKQIYEQALKRLEKEDEQIKGQRTKYRDINSLDVFTSQG